MKQYAEIRKIDEEQRMVWGYASTIERDVQGELVTLDAMKNAWDDYMKFANVREMHQPLAAGTVKEFEFDDYGVMIGVKVVDDNAWKKVVEQVYKGFSIGGSKLPGGFDAATKTITALRLTEISLVDRPANPEALITMFKADITEEDDMKNEAGEQAPVDQLTAMIAKGVITPERLLELVAQDAVAKSAVAVDAAVVEVPVVEVAAKSELQKSVTALTISGDATEIRKGMYQVASFADIIANLVWLQQSCGYEAEYEGDGSQMPKKIATAVTALGDLLLEMATEEVGELMQQLVIPEGTSSLDTLTMVVTNSATATDLQKFNDAFNILKAGARNSATDKDRIQKAHDLMTELGADCIENDPVTEKLDGDGTIAKAEGVTDEAHVHKTSATGDIIKMAGVVEKMAGELATIRKNYGVLQTAHDTLAKAFAKSPAVPKGALKIVEKGIDASDGLSDQPAEVQPILKADGSVDEAATAMKKVHAGGGRQLRS